MRQGHLDGPVLGSGVARTREADTSAVVMAAIPQLRHNSGMTSPSVSRARYDSPGAAPSVRGVGARPFRASVLGALLLSLGTLTPACGNEHSPGSDAATSDGATASDTGASDGGTTSDASATPDTGSLTDGGSSTECTMPSDCALRPRSCCGACGEPTSSDLIALRVDALASYADQICGTTGCPECAGQPDPYLFATCAGGACAPVDLHSDPLAVCVLDADCVLAVPQCCACGAIGLEQAVAYNPAMGSLDARVCDPGPPCPPCVPDFGALRAICEAGHCEVRAGR